MLNQTNTLMQWSKSNPNGVYFWGNVLNSSCFCCDCRYFVCRNFSLPWRVERWQPYLQDKHIASKQQKLIIQNTCLESDNALVNSQQQGKYHQRNQIYKQITAQDVILVDQRGLSSQSLNNAVLPWPVGIGGRPFEILLEHMGDPLVSE